MFFFTQYYQNQETIKLILCLKEKRTKWMCLSEFWSPYDTISEWYNMVIDLNPKQSSRSWIKHPGQFDSRCFIPLLLLFTRTHLFWKRVLTSLEPDVTKACWFITPTLTCLLLASLHILQVFILTSCLFSFKSWTHRECIEA